MKYRVLLSKEALKTLDRVRPATKRRLLAAVEKLKDSPFDGKKLHGELEGSLRIRVGDWRIVYDVDREEQIVVVHLISARGRAYR